MRIEIKEDLHSPFPSGDVEIHIAGKFVCSWESGSVPDILYKDKENLEWVVTLMEKAEEFGFDRGKDSVRDQIKMALGIAI